MLLAGLAAFPHLVLGGHEGRTMARRMAPALAVLALAGLLAAALHMALILAAMTGTSLTALDPGAAREILRGSQLGTVAAVQLAGLTLAAGLALRGRSGGLATSAAAALALAAQVWTGHGGAEEGATGLIVAGASVLHLLAGAAWLGALAGLLWLLGAPGRPAPLGDGAAHRALARFAGGGSLAVAVLLLTGLVRIALSADAAPGELLARPYWQGLAIKLALFLAMCGLAAANRWRFTPALARAIADGNTSRARRRLRLSIAAEGLAGLAVIAIVAWIGTIDPGPL